MARLPDLIEFSARHGLKLATIAQLIEYRRQKERLIEKVVKVGLPTRFGDFTVHLYQSRIDEYLHIALCKGDVGAEVDGETRVQTEPVLVRVHSECLTGDIFHSARCDCGNTAASDPLLSSIRFALHLDASRRSGAMFSRSGSKCSHMRRL